MLVQRGQKVRNPWITASNLRDGDLHEKDYMYLIHHSVCPAPGTGPGTYQTTPKI